MTDAPEEIRPVAFFSIGRTCGGLTYPDHTYVYDPTRDVSVREDVLRRRAAEARAERRAMKKAGEERQGRLL